MDWVHCNGCYVQPGDVKMKKFSITNCGHIYCEDCLQVNQTKECRICRTKYTTIPLTSSMKPEVETFFRDPTIEIKNQLKILEFQQGHRVRLVSHIREKNKIFQALKKESHNLKEELNLFKQENVALRDEIKRLKQDLIEFKRRNDFSSDQSRSSQTFNTPRMHCYSQFLTKDLTPKSNAKTPYANSEKLGEPNFSATWKRPSASDFFVMSDTKLTGRSGRISTPPNIPKILGTYRCNKVWTPDTNTPPTPDSVIKDLSQRDPLQRKVKLPTLKSGSSPATKIAFHGLSLSRPTSTPNKDTPNMNKYFKYFK